MIDSKDLHDVVFESRGTSLFAVEVGRGAPIVFLHGGLADHRSSLHRMGPLATSHRLVLPDVRGAGRSHHAGDLGWDLLADDVAALLDHLGLERAVVGGVSAGSAIALAFALRHPGRVSALVLVSPVYAGDDVGLVPAQRAAMDRMRAAGERAVAEGIAAIFPLFEALPDPVRRVALEMVKSFDAASVAATTRFLATAPAPFERADDLAAIGAPTLILPGTDPEHPASVAELLARSIPKATLVAPTLDAADSVGSFLRRPTELRA